MALRRPRTERLIERLVADLRPWQIERRIRSHRLWMADILAIALPPFALAQPFRADLASRLADAMFVASMATSAMIFVTGLLTMFILGTPGRSWLWLLVPLVAFGLWLVSETASIAVDLFREGWRAWAFETSPQCPLIIGAVGVPVFFALVGVSRVGLIVWRGPTIVIAALSAFSLPATMLNLFHSLDTGAMVLLWHLGSITVFSITAAFLLSRRIPRGLCDWLGL
ncbi:NrsF family protein [Mesorhizobium sp. VNQ89]|uniref:NrsF family protein n=1 Tax=Mesorhizobium quangtriensis TaxID=3157709 RepID=UPI0032B7EEB9